MSKRWDMCTPREGKDGKTFWTRCGVAFESKDGEGFHVVLDATPINGKLSAFKPKDRSGGGGSSGGGGGVYGGASGGGFATGHGGESAPDDEIPFIVDAITIEWDRP